MIPNDTPAPADRLGELAGRIREGIRLAGGAVPFSRFMEQALYEPALGYYEQALIGRAGDFQTSVSTGPLFGELLAFQALRWLDSPPLRDQTLTWIEAGAHDGSFASDFLRALIAHDRSVRVRYGIVEPSPIRRGWQQARLAEFGGMVEWLDDIPEVSGVIFANELLDAFPVERLGWDPGMADWFRWGVTDRDGRFEWCRLPVEGALRQRIPALPAELLGMLPSGYTLEFAPGAEAWWRRAAGQLQAGHLLTFDYGFGAEEWMRPERCHGTLRGYREHRFVDDVLADPGGADLTAHVDFGRIQAIGVEMGLRTGCFTGQDRFLSRLMTETLLPGARFPEWTAERVRQFQTLTHPQHLGRSFRVLVQSRG
jgi:SAM-dependent MidA family methyltransferase